MPRFKNVDWDLPQEASGSIVSWDALHAALMMDIRDELKKLNALLHCQNFTEMPHTLRRLDRRLAKKFKL